MRFTGITLLAACLLPLAASAPAKAQDPVPVARPSSEARVPNFLGATGLLLAPSAYVQEPGAITPFFSGESRFVAGGVVAGVVDRLEVSGTILGGDNGFAGNDTEFLANAKFQLLKETPNLPAFSVGVIDAFSQLPGDPSWYVVASKYFTRADTEQRFALKGHIGYGGGIYDQDLFAGAELVFDRKLSALAEFVNDDFNLGARYQQGAFGATIGLFDFSQLGGGVSYTFRLR